MKRLIALSMLVVGASSANAIMIDDFSTGALDLQLDPPNPFVFGNRNGSMVGGNAYHFIQFLSNPDDNSARLRVNTTSGLQMVSNEDLVQTLSAAAYGTDAFGSFTSSEALNLDLSGQDRFRLNFRSADLPVTLQTLVFDNETNNGTLFTQVVSAGSNFSVDVMFSNLSGYNFADLDSVVFYFNSAASGDFALTSIEAVPEPATMAVLGLGAAALLRRRRK